MDHVVRRPDRFSLLQEVEVALGERGQVAGVEPGFCGPGLERGELADQVAAPGPGALVTRIGVGQRQAGQQVPGHVAADLRVRLLPAAERLGSGGFAIVQAERAEHAFGVQEQQVRGVPGLVLAERAVQQLDVSQGERGGVTRGAVGRVAAGFGRDAGLRLRGAPRGNPVGDESLFGDQGPGADAEDGEQLAPAQAPAWVGLIHIGGPLPGQHFAEDRVGGTCPCNRPRASPGSSPREEILTNCLRRSSRMSRRDRQAVVMGSGQCTRRPRLLSHTNAPRLSGCSSPPIRAGGRVHWPLLVQRPGWPTGTAAGPRSLTTAGSWRFRGSWPRWGRCPVWPGGSGGR